MDVSFPLLGPLLGAQAIASKRGPHTLAAMPACVLADRLLRHRARSPARRAAGAAPTVNGVHLSWNQCSALSRSNSAMTPGPRVAAAPGGRVPMRSLSLFGQTARVPAPSLNTVTGSPTG